MKEGRAMIECHETNREDRPREEGARSTVPSARRAKVAPDSPPATAAGYHAAPAEVEKLP